MKAIKMNDRIAQYFDTLDPANQNALAQRITEMNNMARVMFSNPNIEPFMLHHVLTTSMDKLIHEAHKKLFSCKKGCSHCCSQKVDIARHEAIALVKRAKSCDLKIDIERLKRQAKHSDHHTSWFNLSKEDRKCVFLKDNLCSVYQDRPLMCRKHFTSDPPENCEMPEKAKDDTPVSLYSNLHVEILVFTVFENTKTGPMPQMLLKAIEGKYE